ncbi:MAG: 50S ribosomal protein L21 [Candidatus Zapsychrus exili]|nr:50S ribosomal protein L21 [Candidatus Zapsychrus exili]
MFAIVQIGSAQFKVSEGDVVEVDRLDEEAGKKLSLDQVLLISDDKDVKVGQPHVEGAKIEAQVIKEVKGPKTIAFTYRRTKNSSVKKGHRRKLTSLKIDKISS